MKSRAVQVASGLQERSFAVTEVVAPPRASDVRVEDLGDGSAQVSLRLPWALVLQVLDLASTNEGCGRAVPV